jgi:hypothetical protein
LVCRIYPAEINPFIALKPENKACPPEAWAEYQPVLQRAGAVVDELIRQDIEMSRAADALDAELKRRLCLALNVEHTALVHEAVLAYSPSAETLSSALAFAIATDSVQVPAAQWRFVSDQPESVSNITKSGGIAFHLRDAAGISFQHLGFKREPIFGLGTG